ncbi:MAG: hypothetical protein RRY64_06600 [Oscillospiraceae bacterium]
MKNDENACGTTPCKNNEDESVAGVLGNTKSLLDKAMDVELKIMNLLGENTDEPLCFKIENLVDAAKANREEAVTIVRMMERIAGLLGC